MSNRPRQPDKHEEARFEQLLKSTYGDTPPSAEFEAELLHELDQEFVHTHFPAGSANVVANVAANHARTDTGQHRDKSPRRLIGLRLAMSMAVAASLLLAVALWNSQNAYGWSAMLRALENCGWVQAVSQSSGLSGWVSSQHGVLAIRDGEEVIYQDHHEQISTRYASDSRVLYQQALSTDMASLGPGEQLLGMLLNKSNAEAEATPRQYQIVSESWRELGENQQQVELLVTLRESDPQRSTHKLRVLVDSKTHLPESIELLSRQRGGGESLSFEYPQDGPSSIYALGVPPETKVIAALTDQQQDSSDEARDVESGRLLAQRQTFSESAEPDNRNDELGLTTPLPGSGNPEPIRSGKKSVGPDRASDGTGQRVIADEIVTLAPKQSQPETQTAATPSNKASAEATPTSDATARTVVANDTPSQEAGSADSKPVERLASSAANPAQSAPVLSYVAKPLPLPEFVEQVNEQLATHWEEQGISVANPASDTEFLRRVYLDLTGRIPIPFEVYEYLDSDPDTRREQLVDQLLDSRDHATHLATVWRKLLLPDGVDTATYGGTGKFDQWLADRFEQNVPYDQLVSQLLLAEGRVSDSGPILFYAALKLNPEELAAKTARTFLGMRMECAQCHDHPFDESISQQDFWGFAAHFAQISRPQGKMEMTSSVLRVRDNTRGEVMMPDTEDVVPPRLPYHVAKFTAEPAQTEPTQTGPDPSKSRRQQLVEWLTTKQNSRFARATVNRVWQHLFGLGMVEPVDDMRADNLPNCPEVLDTLSQDFAASGYDLRRLLRALVLSDAYQLSSRASSDEPSQLLEFARMNIKSFTADQLYDCINVATEPVMAAAANNENGALLRIGNNTRQAFIDQFEAPPGQRTDYHAGIPQALTLMHGQLVHGATDLATSGLLKGINAPFYSGDEERIETLFLSTLSRFPEEGELEKMLAHVKSASDDEQRIRAFGDILWALLNCAEFTFIH